MNAWEVSQGLNRRNRQFIMALAGFDSSILIMGDVNNFRSVVLISKGLQS